MLKEWSQNRMKDLTGRGQVHSRLYTQERAYLDMGISSNKDVFLRRNLCPMHFGTAKTVAPIRAHLYARTMDS